MGLLAIFVASLEKCLFTVLRLSSAFEVKLTSDETHRSQVVPW
jgi:hypothetical protein